MNVDRLFLKKLHEVDPKLGCFFNSKIEKFVVTYERTIGGPVPIATVAGMENCVFRQPNDVDLNFVRSGDMTNTRVQDRLTAVAKHMEQVREADKRRASEEFRDLTKDNKIQLMNAFSRRAGTGKGNSAFRRIEPKSRVSEVSAS